jgi:PKD repeat protein
MGAAAPADALTLTSTAPAGWLGTASNPVAVLAAVEAHGDKLPPEFDERLSLALADGTLRVMVAVTDRTAATDAFAESATTTLRWYSDRPRFYGTVTPDQLRTLLQSQRVAFVDPDHPLDFSLAISATNIRARGTDAAPAIWKLNPPTAGNRGSLASQVDGLDVGTATGAGVTAAIVDSGIDATHRDFGGWDCEPEPYQPCDSRIKEATSIGHILGDDLEPADEPTTDLASGHGTHIAGTIAGNGFAARDAAVLAGDLTTYGGDGRPIGIAPQASLVSVKNGDSQAAGLYLFALDWLLANEGRLGVRVVNNSYGCVGGCSFNPASAEAAAIRDLYKAGVVMVHAAGNDAGTDTGTRFSGAAQSPYTIGVANYDAKNLQLADSSSRGLGSAPLPAAATWTPESEPAGGLRRPDVGAPGPGIWATRNLTGGTSSLVPRQSTGDAVGGAGCCIREYATMSGTSMATPHVVGAVTLLASACPSGTPLDYMRAVFASANRGGVLATGGGRTALPYETGYGALDVRAALEWMRTNVRACGYEVSNVAPTASIASADTVTATDAMGLDASGSKDSDGSIASYAWDFGDGTSATGGRVSHAFARSGTYGVRLTVTDDRGATATALKTITVNNATPTAAFGAPESLRHETAGTFDAAGSADRDGSLTAYAWDFGDGTSGSGARVQHAYTWAGDYVVTLVVTDDEGATARTTRAVTVTDIPDSGFKRLQATGLTNHRCSASAWEFTIKPVASGEAPASIAVSWADGSRQRVPLAGVKTKVATYRTSQSLGEIATRAWADVPSASTAAFTLASGPCR